MDLNLSQLKVLRSLQIGALSVGHSRWYRPTVAPVILSTITSSAFSELVIYLMRHEARLPWAVNLLGELRRMQEVRRFELVFLVGGPETWGVRGELAEALKLVTAKGLLDFLHSPPTIRISRSRHHEWDLLDPD